jgi:hypothetical protein
VFYGTLEYSARSIEMTMDTDRTERLQGPVVDEMISLFHSHYAVAHDTIETDRVTLDSLSSKLDQLSEQFDALARRLPQ